MVFAAMISDAALARPARPVDPVDGLGLLGLGRGQLGQHDVGGDPQVDTRRTSSWSMPRTVTGSARLQRGCVAVRQKTGQTTGQLTLDGAERATCDDAVGAVAGDDEATAEALAEAYGLTSDHQLTTPPVTPSPRSPRAPGPRHGRCCRRRTGAVDDPRGLWSGAQQTRQTVPSKTN